jgi:hypothetical protein
MGFWHFGLDASARICVQGAHTVGTIQFYHRSWLACIHQATRVQHHQHVHGSRWVRCAFFDSNLHSRMPLDPTHSSRVSTPLTGWHCKLCPNTEGTSPPDMTGSMPLSQPSLLQTESAPPHPPAKVLRLKHTTGHQQPTLQSSARSRLWTPSFLKETQRGCSHRPYQSRATLATERWMVSRVWQHTDLRARTFFRTLHGSLNQIGRSLSTWRINGSRTRPTLACACLSRTHTLSLSLSPSHSLASSNSQHRHHNMYRYLLPAH